MSRNPIVDKETFKFNSYGFNRHFSSLGSKVRKSIYRQFLALTQITENESVLDVGVSTELTLEDVNFFEKYYPHKNRIAAVGLSPTSELESVYPGLRYFCADAKGMPFDDGEYDYVFSSAVIEHVGSRHEQTRFLKELYRVSRKGVFISTPNRWFPVEFHVVLPFIHWLPPRVFRKTLQTLKKEPLHLEENLNLLSRNDLRTLCNSCGIKTYSILGQKLFGMTSNLLLYISK